MKQWAFINDQMLVNSISAAFQRANIYKDSKNVSDKKRLNLRRKIKELLLHVPAEYYSMVDNEKHCQNIRELAKKITDAFKNTGLLRDDRFRIGIAQKLLNLYLKYLWCLGKIATPPHCPFDNVIIGKLTIEGGTKINWTEMDSLDEYQRLVDAGKKLLIGSKYKTLAAWELDAWQESFQNVTID